MDAPEQILPESEEDKLCIEGIISRLGLSKDSSEKLKAYAREVFEATCR